MSVRMTLAEQYPEAAKKAERHAPNMAAMLHHFHSLNDAGRAIGHKTGNAFYNLVNDNGKCPAGTSEGAAALWVKANLGGVPDAPAPQPAPAGDMIMIAGPVASLKKLARVAAIMGCEVIE